jgi:asparagine synthase (glutamine-hydrolysing)
MDRSFARHSVELRYPYLAPAVVDLAFRLEDKLKVSRGLGKALLRSRLQQKYAQPIVMRRSRLASIPVRDWIASRAQELAPMVAASVGVQEICKPEAVLALFNALQTQKNKRQGLAAWQILFYALWHKIHIEGASSEGSVFEVLNAK